MKINKYRRPPILLSIGILLTIGILALLLFIPLSQTEKTILTVDHKTVVVQNSLPVSPLSFYLLKTALSLTTGQFSGYYEIPPRTPVIYVYQRIRNRRQTPILFSFNNLRTKAQFAGKVSQTLHIDSLNLLHTLETDSLLTPYGFDRNTVVAMFIPNTYEFYWDTTIEQFMQRMKREYDRFWSNERTKQLARTGLSQTELITLASIVEEETQIATDRQLIAGVYLNRLRIGMPLQACPTVKFAVGDFALRRITAVHTTTDHPYNTYQHKGLPPGPIRFASIQTIDQTLNFTPSNYLFFCAKADFSGLHEFARTYSEQQRNAIRYQRELDRRNIKR